MVELGKCLKKLPDSPSPPADTRTATGPPLAAATPVDNRDGFLAINVTPWAEVHIDGAFIDKTPIGRPIRLGTGFHRLKLVYEGLAAYEQNIEINPGRVRALAVDLKNYTATLNIQVAPWGRIAVDGTDKGITPLRPITVLTGTHRITVTNPNYPPKEETVDFRPNKIVSKSFSFP